ncbi:MAG: hypothetical protein KAJ23_05235 [Maribacter sp.]|nr:hypothetical protein [Maribacter sp.]
MKYLLFFCFLTLLVSCNDGDLQIETIDFDSITNVQACDSPVSTASTIFFKINDKEALILELQSGILKNEVSASTTISSAVPDQSKVTYRVFSDKVTSNYFCDAVPTTTPLVIEEIEAENGEVLITTTMVDDGTTITYEHNIKLSGLTFTTSANQRITDLQINDFGVVITQ